MSNPPSTSASPMSPEWERAFAEAYPELLADYVKAVREAEEEARRTLGGSND
jgi:hypothetical protein